jgi:amidase
MALTDLSASELSAGIAARAFSCREVMEAFLGRIEDLNPRLGAIVALRPREALLAEAEAADLAPRKGWLHGLPWAVKDLAATAGIETTWGSRLFAGHVPGADEMLPRRLRAAGAILIGKTNAPEFGLGSHTFNEVHGQTRNPYDLTRTPGGSSGGAAAALAARMLPLADGSDMMGSLRNPAAFCNVYGLRPSAGRVPSDPEGDWLAFPLAADGPMGRSIEDIARLLETLAAPDPGNAWGFPAEPFAEGLDRAPKARIGWLGDWGGAYAVEAGILTQCEAALAAFEGMGCAVEPLAPPFPAEVLWESWILLRSAAIAARRAELYTDKEKRALLKPELIWEIERGLALSASDAARAAALRATWAARAAELFARYDALALPSAQVWPFPVERRYPRGIAGRAMDTYHRWMEIVVPASLAGLPALSLPAGFGAEGLPMGLQLIGPRGGDGAVLRLGQAYHRATDWPGRRPPAM